MRVRSKAELLSHFHEVQAARTVAANYRHEHSSRAHTIVRIRVESALLSPGLPSADAGEGAPALANATSAVLTLADLAGSEAATLNTNHAVAQQGLAVNKSLHWLNVAVHDLGANKPHTQLRNSALTRLLQPSLCGHAVVAVIVTSSACPHEKAGRATPCRLPPATCPRSPCFALTSALSALPLPIAHYDCVRRPGRETLEALTQPLHNRCITR